MKQAQKRPFTFICVKGWAQGNRDRGGIQYAIKAFKEEFLTEWREGKVEMLVKINPAYLSPDHNAHIGAMMAELEVPNEPQIMINTEDLQPEQVKELYDRSDVFVGPSRSEGFGLTGLEARACGLVSIQTNFGGQVDYMEEDSDIQIEGGVLEEVTWDLNYEGTKWLTPDVSEIRKAMRWCYNNQETVAKMGKKAAEHSLKWTWKRAAEKAMVNLKEL